ncbi:MAG: endopeptidase La [Sphingomonadales bacterium]|jgi:ATP-dependent Lon protease|tara:strand:- start:918 stop:3311 length:2394 start_codon:yes stop_codon:yes gene_type:complete
MSKIYPILPLRDIVVFPYMIVPLFVGREKSVKALEQVMNSEKKILLVAQKDASLDEPGAEDLYLMGTLANVLQLLKLPDGTVKVLVEGVQRIKINEFLATEEFFEAKTEEVSLVREDGDELEALSRSVIDKFAQYVKLNKKIPTEVSDTVKEIEDENKLSDVVASHLSLKISDKQQLLENESVTSRLEKIYTVMEGEIGVMQVEKKIRRRVKGQMEKTQKEYYLNEQLKAIQNELGEAEDGKDEISELEAKIKKTKLSKEGKEKANSELKKLRSMSPMSAEAAVVRNYLEWLLSIPWSKKRAVRNDISAAEKILNEDHYGLGKVKERILEFLAVQTRTKKNKGPILCLVGPPGVGKTSLGKSIARATGREYVRFSVGGVRDEAEIRGHRRTYIGSMPGKVIQSMKKAGSSNPMFLLDEIDKMGSDFRGDPSSALLEVLDPEQNNTFNDHYLEIDYDLSDVMFITTANTLNMPGPLLDRMEIIRLSGYTEDEKAEIAKRHLIAKQVKGHGLKDDEWSISNAALHDLIRYYTREAGVRSLEREIANLIRKATKQIVMGKTKKVNVTVKNLEKFAGIKKYRFGEVDDQDMVGITTGLAWTEVGGVILSIEAIVSRGKGKVTITGKLGDVMQESIKAALSYVRSKAPEFGIQPNTFEEKDIHIHVPEGATPKDGPSAGVAMITSLVSVLTGIPVRYDVAMTGEISLRGKVMPIGGLKEKLLAAHRSGVKKVLIPIENEKDLVEIPDNVKKGLEIIPMTKVDQVLEHALASPLVSLREDQIEGVAVMRKGESDSNFKDQLHH